jgi:hypothetical protein
MAAPTAVAAPTMEILFDAIPHNAIETGCWDGAIEGSHVGQARIAASELVADSDTSACMHHGIRPALACTATSRQADVTVDPPKGVMQTTCRLYFAAEIVGS